MNRSLIRLTQLPTAERNYVLQVVDALLSNPVNLNYESIYGWTDLRNGWAVHLSEPEPWVEQNINLGALSEEIPDMYTGDGTLPLLPAKEESVDKLLILDPGQRFDWPSFEALWRRDLPNLLPHAAMAFKDFGLNTDLLCPYRRPRLPRWSAPLLGRNQAPAAPNEYWCLFDEPRLASAKIGLEDDLIVECTLPDVLQVSGDLIELAGEELTRHLGRDPLTSSFDGSSKTLSLTYSLPEAT